MYPLRIYTGFDSREAVGWSVFCRSVIENTTIPVSITPIDERIAKRVGGKRDGATAFSFARFMVPVLEDFSGWALWCDGTDMLSLGDLSELWTIVDGLESMKKAVYVVKHPEYSPKEAVKFKGSALESENRAYPRKNWSSLILWNCASRRNRILSPDFISRQSGEFLHRFQWLEGEDLIGDLPLEWNWLVGQYDTNDRAKLLHFTYGIPSLSRHYNTGPEAKLWRDYATKASRGMNC